jgi:succinoglycan biosynthesis protein ExoA
VQLVLIVIPALNEAATIGGLIASLRQGLPKDLEVRFVVADGGSTDGTQAIVRGAMAELPQLHLLHNDKRLQSAGINLAASAHGADAEILIRCDAHAQYPDGYAARLVESLRVHEADAVVVPMDSIGDTCIRKAVAWVSDTPLGSGGSAHRGGRASGWVDHGHHAAFRMSSFRRAGGYDESFSHNEDAELDCRQHAMGSRIFLDADIRIGYFPRNSFKALWRQYFNYGFGRSRTVRKHPGSLRLRQFAVPAHVVLSLAGLALTPWSAWFALWPAMYLGALLAGSAALAVKHRSLCGLLTGAAAFVMHTAWALGFFAGWATRREVRWSAAPAAESAPCSFGPPP